MPRAKCQLQIRLFLTLPHLAAGRRPAIRPSNVITRLIAWLNAQRASREAIAEERVQVVPDEGFVDVVGEDQLAGIWREEAVEGRSDLERDAAGDEVGVELFAVGAVFEEGNLVAHVAADGPEVDGVVALVGDYRATDCEDPRGKSYEGKDG